MTKAEVRRRHREYEETRQLVYQSNAEDFTEHEWRKLLTLHIRRTDLVLEASKTKQGKRYLRELGGTTDQLEESRAILLEELVNL